MLETVISEENEMLITGEINFNYLEDADQNDELCN